MAISTEELRNKIFPIVKKGYHRPDVHRYLGAIADELEAFNRTVDGGQQPLAAVDAPAPVQHVPTESGDAEFERVGKEVSLMLRQATETSVQIREDAEAEATALIEQVRADIEADREAHDHAARQLIERTEERAGEIRAEAEAYAERTRAAADQAAAGSGGYDLPMDDESLNLAQSRVTDLAAAEERARQNLETARRNIQIALEQLDQG